MGVYGVVLSVLEGMAVLEIYRHTESFPLSALIHEMDLAPNGDMPFFESVLTKI